GSSRMIPSQDGSCVSGFSCHKGSGQLYACRLLASRQELSCTEVLATRHDIAIVISDLEVRDKAASAVGLVGGDKRTRRPVEALKRHRDAGSAGQVHGLGQSLDSMTLHLLTRDPVDTCQRKH